MESLGGPDGKESACNVGDPSSIPGSGRSPGEGNGNPFQYSCLENSMVRGTGQAPVHGVAKNWTQLSGFTAHFTSNNLISSDWTTMIHTDLPGFTLVASQSHHHHGTETEWLVVVLDLPPCNNPVFTLSSMHLNYFSASHSSPLKLLQHKTFVSLTAQTHPYLTAFTLTS